MKIFKLLLPLVFSVGSVLFLLQGKIVECLLSLVLADTTSLHLAMEELKEKLDAK